LADCPRADSFNPACKSRLPKRSSGTKPSATATSDESAKVKASARALTLISSARGRWP